MQESAADFNALFIWLWASLSLLMFLLVCIAFAWAVRNGQFSDSRRAAGLALKENSRCPEDLPHV